MPQDLLQEVEFQRLAAEAVQRMMVEILLERRIRRASNVGEDAAERDHEFAALNDDVVEDVDPSLIVSIPSHAVT